MLSSQRGISLFLTIIILAIILSIVIGLSAILVNQLEMAKGLGYLIVAFYAADTGVEKVLKTVLEDIKSGDYDNLSNEYTENLDEKTSYRVTVVCCDSNNENCYFQGDCPNWLSEDNNCESTYFCIESEGIYEGAYESAKRKIRVEVFPQRQ